MNLMNNPNLVEVGDDWDVISAIALALPHGTPPVVVEVHTNGEIMLPGMHNFPTHEGFYTLEQWQALTENQRLETLAKGIMGSWAIIQGENTNPEKMATVAYEIVDLPEFVESRLLFTITMPEA